MTIKFIKFALVLVSALALVQVTACASQPERADRDEELEAAEPDDEERAQRQEKPSPEELADSPCGNPDWAQLPPGAEDTPADGEEPGQDDGSNDGEESSDSTTRKVAERAQMTPCQ